MNFRNISKKSLAHPRVATNVMLKFQKDLTSSFEFLRPQENVTPNAGQNPGVTEIPLSLRAGDKKLERSNIYFSRYRVIKEFLN